MANGFLNITCRKTGSESTEYLPIAENGLKVSVSEEEAVELGRRITVTVANDTVRDWSGVIKFEAAFEAEKPLFFMPGFMYGTNTGEFPRSGRKEFPRIRRTECVRPESKDWMVRSDRLAYPVSLIYDNGRVLGISAVPYFVKDGKDKVPCNTAEQASGSADFYQYSGFTCCVDRQITRGGETGTYATCGYTLGYENAPWLFVETADVKERDPLTESNSFEIRAGESVSFRLRIYYYPAEKITDIYSAMKEVYADYHQSPRSMGEMTLTDAVGMLAGAIAENAWIPEDHMYTGFVFDRPEGPVYNKIQSLSWTNGLAVAVPMLLSGLRLENEDMRAQAIDCIDYIVKTSLNEASGLPYDALEDGVWSVKGWWYDGMHMPGHSAYLCGQALYYILKAYMYEKSIKGVEHSDWIDFVSPIIRKLNKTLNGEMEYPFVLSAENGCGLEYDSLGGSWCLAAAVNFIQATSIAYDLSLLQEVEQHYYDKFIAKAQCYGGPLDTDKAIDNEGVLAYIRAVRGLHEITGDDKYIGHMRDALYYEFSFKLCYNTPVKIPPLSTIGWSSCGGSITSTANPHIHPMSSSIVDEIRYYVDRTGDEYAGARMEDTIRWGMQTFNTFDGEYGYGKIGWMSERFCFCQGLLSEKYPDGSPASTWFALMPWAGASILEGFTS